MASSAKPRVLLCRAMFAGTMPMALATIVNCIVLIAVPRLGQSMAVLAWVLWWIDVAITILASFGIPFIMCARLIR